MRDQNKKIKIAIASDHAGFPLKDHLVKTFTPQPPYKGEQELNIEFTDCGCTDEFISVNYPELANIACQKIIDKETGLGILICGSGVGISMAANKYSSEIRAALCRDTITAQLSRQHNNANILCLGAWFTANKLAEEILKTFVNSQYEGGRHQLRVEILKNRI